MAAGKTFKILVTQGGNTRTLYSKADGTVNAIWQVLNDLKSGDGHVTIVAKPHEPSTVGEIAPSPFYDSVPA